MVRQYVVNNRWTFPYHPLLIKTFDAHINVDFCSSIKSIKYACKYVNKGSDGIMFGLLKEHSHGEVKQYQVGLDISSNEALWRISGFLLHQQHPAIEQLVVNLENG